MRGSDQNRRRAFFLAGPALVIVLLFAFWAIISKYETGNWLVTSYEKKARRLELVNLIKTNLLASTEAEKSAVMANTDEESHNYAAQSKRATEAVEEARGGLLALLDEKKTGNETETFQQFSSCWEKLQEIDREILTLAVQNTNIKALRLSFVPAGEAIKRMGSSLEQLMDAEASSPAVLKITRLASTALIETLNIYTLHAPHIAETSDPEMDKIEEVMNRHDEQVNKSLQGLNDILDDSGRPFLDRARASYDEFRKIHGEIINLSRQNSNIKSFAISLGQKRNVTAQCMASLSGLEKALQESMTFSATR